MRFVSMGSTTIEVSALALMFQAAALTDIGRARRSNQDSYGCDDSLGLYVVCDGMGGAAGGDIASAIASETFLDTARRELESLGTHSSQASSMALQRAVAAANRAVVERSAWDTRLRGMGTTLVGVHVLDAQLTVIHVGDSRAYLVRDDDATQLTADHSLVSEQVRLGVLTLDQAEASSLRSVITRAIGVDPDVRPDVQTLALQPRDTLLLASDGLTRHVTDSEIAAILSADDAIPAGLAQQLIDLANQRGGSDNITAIVIRF
jgi:serine/threonine protein phosphatase PrpC